MWPHQGGVEGEDQLPRPAGPALFNEPQETIGLLDHKGTLLAHGQPVVHKNTQVLCRARLQKVIPKNVLMYALISPQVQDSTLALVKRRQVLPCTALQSV